MDDTINRIPSPVAKVNYTRKKMIANCDYLQNETTNMEGVEASRYVFRQMIIALRYDIIAAYKEDKEFREFIDKELK